MQLRGKKYICFYPLTCIHNIAYIKKRQIYLVNSNSKISKQASALKNQCTKLDWPFLQSRMVYRMSRFNICTCRILHGGQEQYLTSERTLYFIKRNIRWSKKKEKNYNKYLTVYQVVSPHHYSYFKPPHLPIRALVLHCTLQCNGNSRCLGRLAPLGEQVYLVRSSTLFAKFSCCCL